MKLDISKAFDSVSWEYLIELLQHRGFLAKWRNWLCLLLSSSSSSVHMNGVDGPWIKHRRGLHQGDPLSPYLFILAIDTLQHILERATEDGMMSPLRDRMARLRLSLYADDAAVFVNPTKANVDMIMQIMERFGESTSLRINVQKSSVAPITCSQVDLNQVLQKFFGARTQLPITYLGMPLCLGRLHMVHLQPVLDKVAGRLADWQGKLMNIGGHMELVKTVLGALPTYLLMAVRLPKKFYSAMDKIRKKFLWAGSQQLHGGKCKVNWLRVCRPLKYGGLGISDLERFG
jgi:hypothetical protein